MTKKDLAAALAAKTELNKENASKWLDAVIEAISEALTGGDKVTFPGFGTFTVEKRAARDGRNPQTGKAMKIPAKKVVKFKAGKTLKESVDNKK